jgi:hypothetical protein
MKNIQDKICWQFLPEAHSQIGQKACELIYDYIDDQIFDQIWQWLHYQIKEQVQFQVLE